jgi:hypothetical protein
MRDLLSAIRADLLDRRMRLPALAAVIALVVLAYAELGGHSEAVNVASSEPGAAGAAGTPSLGGAAAPANPRKAQAETTYGGAYQHSGGALVDPFKTLVSTTTTTTTSTTGTSAGQGQPAGSAAGKATSGGSSGGSGSSSPAGGHSGSGGGSSTPTPPPKPKARTVYVVDVEFGKAPAAPGEAPHLVAFKGIKVGAPVPSKSNRLMVLETATLDGKSIEKGQTKASAKFALSSSRPPIVSGPGQCLPSPTQCEFLRLQLGQTEDLQYLESGGQTVTYLLKLSGVFKHTVLVP